MPHFYHTLTHRLASAVGPKLQKNVFLLSCPYHKKSTSTYCQKHFSHWNYQFYPWEIMRMKMAMALRVTGRVHISQGAPYYYALHLPAPPTCTCKSRSGTLNIHMCQPASTYFIHLHILPMPPKAYSIRNIATGETSQAITPFHFFDNFNFHH